MPKLQPIRADSYKDLCRQLKQIEVSVRSRGKGRKTEQVEIWSIRRFLFTYGGTSLISYPLQIEHADRPDFRLHMPSGSVGVECTEAVHEQLAHLEAVVKKQKNPISPSQIIDPSPFREGKKPLSAKEIHEMARQPGNRPKGKGWHGYEPEKEWAEGIMKRIKEKVDAFYRPDFKKYPRNWLIIYDNRHEPVEPDMQQAYQHLFQAILQNLLPELKNKGLKLPFVPIFIKDSSHFYRLNDGIHRKAIVDL